MLAPLTDTTAKQYIWKLGHFWCPENLGLLPVAYADLPGLSMQDDRVINAFRSFSVIAHSVYTPAALRAHGRPPIFDGELGPAMETALMAERCAVPDIAPPEDALLTCDDPDAQIALMGLQEAPAIGSGNWKGCHGIGKFHSATVGVNRSGIGSQLQPVFHEVLKNVQRAYDSIGLRFLFIEDGKDMLTGKSFTGQINIVFTFVQRSSGWIGLAIIGQNQGCRSQIWCQYLATYRPSNVTDLWTTLIKHELGHNCGRQHTNGGVMNPFILGGLPFIWPANDPSTSWLKAQFGGVPIDDVTPPGPPKPPEDSIEKRIDTLELQMSVLTETVKYLLNR